jgi:hypothetical protein
MPKVCTLNADCTVAQLSLIRLGIDTLDRETLLVVYLGLKRGRGQTGRRLKGSLVPTTFVLVMNRETVLLGV